MRLSFLEDDKRPCTLDDLRAVGVLYERLPTEPSGYQAAIDELRRSRGYLTQDEVALGPDTPNLDELLGRFADEHLHTDDEVRLVLAGGGIFDIRSKDDEWMRVEVSAGDLLVVPAGCNHRFFLDASRTIRCVRLFKDQGGWTPVYRQRPA